ncbi:MAG: hypothetical protein IPM42_18025 [Saprospiraceae bacterium]|nr:hypothetical protein [Saprospiraceae bacterium]
MKFKITILAFVITGLLIQSCKNDAKTGENNETKTKNNVVGFKDTPASDISDVFQFRKDQFVPEHNNAYYMKTQSAFTIFMQGSETPETVNFEENSVVAIFLEKNKYEVNFEANSFDNSGENTKIEVTSIPTNIEVEEYRPTFVIKIPKKDIKGVPVVRVNGVIAPVTMVE